MYCCVKGVFVALAVAFIVSCASPQGVQQGRKGISY